MKRVLLHYPILNMGGAERSSLRLIKALADRGWDVTLVLTTGGGALERAVDARVKIVCLRPYAFGNHFANARGLAASLFALPDLLAYVFMRVIGAARMIQFLFRDYDAAAVLLMGTPSTFVRRIIRADVKAIWIRNDLSCADPNGQITARLKVAAPKIDYFLCVSEVSRRSLVSAVPEVSFKAIVAHNILDAEEMRVLADAAEPPFTPWPDGRLVVLSVCRLSDRSKGLRRMVRVCRAMMDAGLDFHWYVAGEGPDRALIEADIAAAKVGARMTLLGQLNNPYPAYRAADVVAMLSYFEGLCGVINEARVLERPVIATQVSGVDEQLIDGVNGLIVPQEERQIVAGMKRILTDAGLRARLAQGGYSEALLDDDAKMDRIEALFLGKRTRS
jgi:glycosyltransferase involved in cell wall biosynthesis